MELSVIEKSDELIIIGLEGRLDVAGVQKIDNVFQGHVCTHRQNTIVDLSGVSFMASLGMTMIVTCAKHLKSYNKKLVIAAPQELVAEAWKAADLDSVIPIADTVDEARTLFE